MRGMPARIRRLSERQYVRDREAAIAQAAVEYGIDEAELRAEILAWEERVRLYGPESPDQIIARTAAELGIDEAELRASVEQQMAERGDRV